MDMELAKLAFQIGQFLLTGGVGFYVYMSNKNKVTNDRISALEMGLDTRLDDHASRIARLEEAAKHAPTHTDLSAIYTEMKASRQAQADQMATMREDLRQLRGEFAGASKNIDLITEYLLKGGKS